MPVKKLFAVKKSGLGSGFIFDGDNPKSPSVKLPIEDAIAECYWWEVVSKPINGKAILHDVSANKDLDWGDIMKSKKLEKKVLELYEKKKNKLQEMLGPCCSDEE